MAIFPTEQFNVILLGLFKVPLIPWRNCWAQPHHRMILMQTKLRPQGRAGRMRCVTRCSSGGRAQWFLSDAPPGKASPNNQTELLAGRKGTPAQQPSKQSIIPPLGSCFLLHKLVRASPRFLSSHQQLRLQRAAQIWVSCWICGEHPALSSTRTRVGLHGWSPVYLRKGGRTGSPWLWQEWPLSQCDNTLGCSSSPSMVTAQGPWAGRDSGRDSEISTSRTEERVKACQVICPTKAFPKTKALMNNIVNTITKAFDILMLKKVLFAHDQLLQ